MPTSGNFLMWVADQVNGTWGAAHQLQGPPGTWRMSGMLSCATPGNCAVDGIYESTQNTHNEAYVASEVDGTWQPGQEVTGLAGQPTEADAISCAAAGDCTATGAYDVSGHWQEYAVDEVNGTWGTAQAMQNVPAFDPAIESLSCTAPGYCTAVGQLRGSLSLLSEATGTVTTMQVAASTVSYGDEQAAPVTVTVTSPAGGTPAGTVTLTVAPAETAVTGCTVTLVAGTGSCALPATALAADTYQLVAIYDGDTTYAVSASATSTVAVTPEATTTTLALSASTASYGHESVVRVSAVTTGQYGPVNTGLVSVEHGNQEVCAIRLHAGQGSCLLPDTALGVGTAQLTGLASPDGSFTASVSASLAVRIVKGSDTTTLKLSRAVVSYGHETLERLSVRTSSRFRGTPGGRVTVKAGRVTLCVITLRAGAGSCVLTARQLRRGRYALVAGYGGNGSFAGSSSAREALTAM
jgi:hypothetical protein